MNKDQGTFRFNPYSAVKLILRGSMARGDFLNATSKNFAMKTDDKFTQKR